MFTAWLDVAVLLGAALLKKKLVYGHSMPSLWLFFLMFLPTLWGILRFITFITSVYGYKRYKSPQLPPLRRRWGFAQLGLQTPHICQDGVLLALLRASTAIDLAMAGSIEKGGWSVDSRPGKHTKNIKKPWENHQTMGTSTISMGHFFQFANCWFTKRVDLERVFFCLVFLIAAYQHAP